VCREDGRAAADETRCCAAAVAGLLLLGSATAAAMTGAEREYVTTDETRRNLQRVPSPVSLGSAKFEWAVPWLVRFRQHTVL
jgi:hypothetical protein